nr:diguanylate cyclase [uncultured Desulfobacter sp.]
MRKTQYLFLAIIILMSVLAVYNARKNAAEYFIDDYSNRINLSYQFALKKTGIVADILYRQYEEAIGKMFYEYGRAISDEKFSIREKMLDTFMPVYENSQELGLRRLHFHLADGINLIRFHKPGMYGDPLMPFRKSIRLVNETQKFVSGFEAGRFWTGFRFIYPVFFNGQFLGSVEMGFDFDAIKREMSTYTLSSSIMTLKKNIIKKTLLNKKEIKNYQTCKINHNFIVEKNYRPLLSKHLEQCKWLYANISDVSQRMDTLMPFNQVIRKNNAFNLIHFLSIKDIAGNRVGYIITVIQDIDAPPLSYFFYAKIVIGAAGLILLMLYWNNRINKLNKALKQKSEKLKTLSITDALTGQYNRFKTEEVLLNEFERFERYGEKICVLLLDIDKFKAVNDTFGHDFGDKVLTEFSSLVSQNLRRVDVLGRWGGEEFIVICPGTSLENGGKVAENLRSMVQGHCFAPVPEVTVSIGVSAFHENDHAYTDAVKRADNALYRSKRTGRNRVCSMTCDSQAAECL